MDSWIRDLRYTWRGMRAKPAFSLIVILTLALGIGANTAIFSVVYGVLIAPLGYPDEEKLVFLPAAHRLDGDAGQRHFFPDYWFWREHSQSFEDLAAYAWFGVTLEEADRVQQMQALFVSENLFHTLGVEPALGRLFTEADVVPGRGHVALISHGMWQRLWGGDTSVVGRSVPIDGDLVTIIGVLPSGA